MYSYFFSDENIWKKFKRKFNAKNEVSVHRHYDDYYGRKFSIELGTGGPRIARKIVPKILLPIQNRTI